MSGRRQVLIAAVAGIGITVLFFLFLLSPKLAQIQDVRDRIDAAEGQTAQLQSQLQRLEEARRNAPRTTARLATVTDYLPSSPDLPGFIRQMQDAATKAGVDLRSIGPAAPVDLEGAQGVQTIAVSMTARGAFARVEDLLARVEGLERVLQINSVTLTPVRDDLTGALVLDATLQGTMYVVQADARVTGSGSGTTVGGSS